MAIRTFNFSFAGSGATVTGALALDTDLVNQSGPGSIPIDSIESLSVTVAGAPAGNGTFGKQDFTSVTFFSVAPLDFNRELVGQEQGDALPFGTPDTLGNSGDFNLVGAGGEAPNGNAAFSLYTNGGEPPNVFALLKSVAPA